MSTETGRHAKPMNGDKLYQQRARKALPLLVRQAHCRETISYSDLAEEMGMPNPRNLNFVLGSIGQSILQLSGEWNEKVPPIECLVINKSNGLPGEGIGFFIDKSEFKKMSRRQQRAVVEAQLQKIFAYPRWNSVLDAFSLSPDNANFTRLIRSATSGGVAGGESEKHKALKEYVAEHPQVVGLKSSAGHGQTEYVLPSGDKLDVLFQNRDEWIAVEVKSDISSEGDLVRGVFQCVKYQAVLEACLLSTNRKPNARTVLVTTRHLPHQIVSLKNMLGVEVLEIELSCCI